MSTQERQNEIELERLRFIAMIIDSWTFIKLTEQEKETIIKLLKETKLFYTKRLYIHETLHAIYLAYITGLGYNNTADWER